MLCRAARGGLLSRNALCRGPSIAPTANIPQPDPNPQPRRSVAPPELRRARGAWGARKRSVARPRASGAALRAAQQKSPNAPREAAAGEGEGARAGSALPRFRESRIRSRALVPRSRLRALCFSSSPPPREISKRYHAAGPGSLSQGWEAQSVRFDVGGRGPARSPRGASKRAAFRPVRASDLAPRSALLAAAQLSRTHRSPGGRSANGRRGYRARHCLGPGLNAPERAV